MLKSKGHTVDPCGNLPTASLGVESVPACSLECSTPGRLASATTKEAWIPCLVVCVFLCPAKQSLRNRRADSRWCNVLGGLIAGLLLFCGGSRIGKVGYFCDLQRTSQIFFYGRFPYLFHFCRRFESSLGSLPAFGIGGDMFPWCGEVLEFQLTYRWCRSRPHILLIRVASEMLSTPGLFLTWRWQG